MPFSLRLVRALAAAGLALAPAPAGASAAAFVPDDPGTGGGWSSDQWNLAGPFGVDAPDAWANLIADGAPGGRGVIVAVLDTGVAYADRGPFGRSPDLAPSRFVRGYDFVDGDPYPTDRNGHGTFVASTIAETTDNGLGLTGLAYGARIMPIRVLADDGSGKAADIARGIRFAADRGAKVINLSLTFPPGVTASTIPTVTDAIDAAYRKGVLVIAATGDEGRDAVDYPARASHVLAVGATTEHGCLASYSNHGPRVDLVAPGGGDDARIPSDPDCRPTNPTPDRSILQMTLATPFHAGFGMPPVRYVGTSMAAPHVAAAAALIVASGTLGRDPSPDALTRRLERSARDLGPAGDDALYGNGLLDAATATDGPR